MSELDEKKRNHCRLQLAFSRQRKKPLENAAPVRNASACFNQVEGVTAAERDEVWKHIAAATSSCAVDVHEAS